MFRPIAEAVRRSQSLCPQIRHCPGLKPMPPHWADATAETPSPLTSFAQRNLSAPKAPFDLICVDAKRVDCA
jgi:hypothetical protein